MTTSKFVVAVLAGGAVLGPWTFGCSESAVDDGGGGTEAGSAAGRGGGGGSGRSAGRAGATPDGADDGSDASACEPLPDDAECATCTRTSCCEDLQTYTDATDRESFETCIEPCEDQDCVDACAARAKAAGGAYDALGDCQLDQCAAPCLCEATEGDSSCLACTKVECCTELVPYALASDFDDFSICMEPCTESACADRCVANFPAAGAAYQAYSDCALSACPEECG